MDYIFVFVGEFGVELLNWQGAVRKLHDRLPPGDRIVCASRASLYPLYEHADAYVEISSVPRFRQSRAMAYFALPGPASSWDSFAARRFNEVLKADLVAHITGELQHGGFWPADEGAGLPPHCFVFSSDRSIHSGVTFGRSRHGLAGSALITLYERLKVAFPGQLLAIEQSKRRLLEVVRSLDRSTDANIYELLDIDNNHFICIRPDMSLAADVMGKLGWDLSQPFILCQTRQRDTVQRSVGLLPQDAILNLITAIAGSIRVVLLSFSTGRWLDSYSTFGEVPNCTTFHCQSFPEQALLVASAAHCLFFTEGDFGSHIYVPPFMGRDVTAIAPASVFSLGTTPIDFWNREVFKFGGQIKPLVAEECLASESHIQDLAEALLAAVRATPAPQETSHVTYR